MQSDLKTLETQTIPPPIEMRWIGLKSQMNDDVVVDMNDQSIQHWIGCMGYDTWFTLKSLPRLVVDWIFTHNTWNRYFKIITNDDDTAVMKIVSKHKEKIS